MKTLDYVTCKQAWLDFDFVLGGISNIFCISFTMFSWTLTSFLLPCSSTNTSQIVSWQRYYNYISQFCISLTSWWCLRQLHIYVSFSGVGWEGSCFPWEWWNSVRRIWLKWKWAIYIFIEQNFSFPFWVDEVCVSNKWI